MLQVVSATTTTATSITSTSVFADTTITATITPTLATSKILVLIMSSVSVGSSASSTIAGSQAKLLRDAVALFTNSKVQLMEWSSVADKSIYNVNSYSYLDSPATTSATTYKLQACAIYGSQTVIYQQNSDKLSSIILMEIGV